MKGYGFPSEGESTQAKPPRILLKTILEQVVSAWAMELPFLCRGVLGPARGGPFNFGSLRRLPSDLPCLCTRLRIVPLRPWKLGPFADFSSPSGSFSSLALLKIRKEPLIRAPVSESAARLLLNLQVPGRAPAWKTRGSRWE